MWMGGRPGSGTLASCNLVAIFLALVWLDSAAFSILQSTPELNQFGWGSAGLQWKNALMHLTMAMIGGFFLDRGRLNRVLLVAFAALASAALCVSTHTQAALMTHWLYAGGVSLYSTALVFAPTADRRIGVSEAAMRAGILFAVSGWAGSAFGIGMAQDLHRIPVWFLGLAGFIVLCCSGLPAGSSWSDLIRRAALIGGIGTLALLITKVPGTSGIGVAHGTADAAAGREVYISEGCLNCHTQFVRMGTPDELWWGPVATPENSLKQAPPLIGNRRQGPDLMNIGNRRSPAWNRIHLIDPRSLSPKFPNAVLRVPLRSRRQPRRCFGRVPCESRGGHFRSAYPYVPELASRSRGEAGGKVRAGGAFPILLRAMSRGARNGRRPARRERGTCGPPEFDARRVALLCAQFASSEPGARANDQIRRAWNLDART